MNVRRFTARTSREALARVREAFGEDAVVLSTKPCTEGVEVLAMGPEGLQHIETLSQTAPRAAAPAAAQAPVARAARPAAEAKVEVKADTEQLSMSTLSFQDYVRERMLRRRQAALQRERAAEPVLHEAQATPAQRALAAAMSAHGMPPLADEPPARAPAAAAATSNLSSRSALQSFAARAAAAFEGEIAAPAPILAPAAPAAPLQHPGLNLPRTRPARTPVQMPVQEPPMLSDAIALDPIADAAVPELPPIAQRREQQMMDELRSMKGLIEERFGALAFMEKLQRHPVQARLAQKLLDAAFSPALIRRLVDALPADCEDEQAWAANVIERNLPTGEHDLAIEDQGGVFALIGSTGVGKTTSTAKIAAAFATRHGAANLGLITLDAYRVAAHEQLRAYGRILGVPVHTAHDRATLEDLLDLLGGKKMVLIDTAGIGQRDARTRDLLDMLGHRAINRLLVVNAAAQGETIDDVMTAYRASECAGVVLSKIDEAMKLAPAIDAAIRHKLKVVGVANGQRVPEDWHRLTAHALVQRALRATTGTAYRMDASDVNLVFATAVQGAATGTASGAGLHA